MRVNLRNYHANVFQDRRRLLGSGAREFGVVLRIPFAASKPVDLQDLPRCRSHGPVTLKTLPLAVHKTVAVHIEPIRSDVKFR